MTDIVNRLKTFVAPENWDADQLIFDATKEIERLRSAKSDSSQLDIEVESLKVRVKQLESALREIDQQRYTGRNTINLDNAYEMAIALNAKLLAVMDTARAALEERT